MEILDYGKYQESIAKEFIVKKDRLRSIIADKHWLEEGRYKEILIMEYLKSVLPSNFSVGTGFVVNNGEISTQIDIIIYKNDEIVIFKTGDFVVVPAHSVYGIIEVKSTISTNIYEIINKSNDNGELIFKNRTNRQKLFHGIFGYSVDGDIKNVISKISKENIKTNEDTNNCMGKIVNNICIGSNCYINQNKDDNNYHIYIYTDKEQELAFTDFFSSLLENIVPVDKNADYGISNDVIKFLFPQNKNANQIIEILHNQTKGNK